MFIKIKVLHEHTGLVGFYFPPGVESTPTFATFCGEKLLVYRWVRVEFLEVVLSL